MIERILECARFSVDELRAWGGDLVAEGGFPRVTTPKIAALRAGAVQCLVE
jgi:hypothetical protein